MIHHKAGKDDKTLAELVEYYLLKPSERIAEVIAGVKVPKERVIFDKVRSHLPNSLSSNSSSSKWSTPEQALTSLTLLLGVVSKRPDWLIPLADHSVVPQIIKLLKTADKVTPDARSAAFIDTQIIVACQLIVATLVPYFPRSNLPVQTFLGEVLDTILPAAKLIYRALEAQDPNLPHPPSLVHLLSSLSEIICRCYATFPRTTLSRLKSDFAGSGSLEQLFETVVSPLLDRFKLHPTLASDGDKGCPDSILVERWRLTEPESIAVFSDSLIVSTDRDGGFRAKGRFDQKPMYQVYSPPDISSKLPPPKTYIPDGGAASSSRTRRSFSSFFRRSNSIAEKSSSGTITQKPLPVVQCVPVNHPHRPLIGPIGVDRLSYSKSASVLFSITRPTDPLSRDQRRSVVKRCRSEPSNFKMALIFDETPFDVNGVARSSILKHGFKYGRYHSLQNETASNSDSHPARSVDIGACAPLRRRSMSHLLPHFRRVRMDSNVSIGQSKDALNQSRFAIGDRESGPPKITPVDRVRDIFLRYFDDFLINVDVSIMENPRHLDETTPSQNGESHTTRLTADDKDGADQPESARWRHECAMTRLRLNYEAVRNRGNDFCRSRAIAKESEWRKRESEMACLRNKASWLQESLDALIKEKEQQRDGTASAPGPKLSAEARNIVKADAILISELRGKLERFRNQNSELTYELEFRGSQNGHLTTEIGRLRTQLNQLEFELNDHKYKQGYHRTLRQKVNKLNLTLNQTLKVNKELKIRVKEFELEKEAGHAKQAELLRQAELVSKISQVDGQRQEIILLRGRVQTLTEALERGEEKLVEGEKMVAYVNDLNNGRLEALTSKYNAVKAINASLESDLILYKIKESSSHSSRNIASPTDHTKYCSSPASAPPKNYFAIQQNGVRPCSRSGASTPGEKLSSRVSHPPQAFPRASTSRCFHKTQLQDSRKSAFKTLNVAPLGRVGSIVTEDEMGTADQAPDPDPIDTGELIGTTANVYPPIGTSESRFGKMLLKASIAVARFILDTGDIPTGRVIPPTPKAPTLGSRDTKVLAQPKHSFASIFSSFPATEQDSSRDLDRSEARFIKPRTFAPEIVARDGRELRTSFGFKVAHARDVNLDSIPSQGRPFSSISPSDQSSSSTAGSGIDRHSGYTQHSPFLEDYESDEQLFSAFRRAGTFPRASQVPDDGRFGTSAPQNGGRQNFR